MDFNRTLSILQPFVDFPYNLNALSLLEDFDRMLNETSGFIDRINFNILGTMLIVKEAIIAL